MKKTLQNFSFVYENDDVVVTVKYNEFGMYDILMDWNAGWVPLEQFNTAVKFLDEVMKDLETKPNVIKLFGG